MIKVDVPSETRNIKPQPGDVIEFIDGIDDRNDKEYYLVVSDWQRLRTYLVKIDEDIPYVTSDTYSSMVLERGKAIGKSEQIFIK